jgi:hypothetical protein
MYKLWFLHNAAFCRVDAGIALYRKFYDVRKKNVLPPSGVTADISPSRFLLVTSRAVCGTFFTIITTEALSGNSVGRVSMRALGIGDVAEFVAQVSKGLFGLPAQII